MKQSWKVIRKLCNGWVNNSIGNIKINGDIFSSHTDIAEKFNHFFVTIADELAQNLPPSTNSPYEYVVRSGNMLSAYSILLRRQSVRRS